MKNKILFSDKIFIAGSSGMVGSAIKKKLIDFAANFPKEKLNILTPSKQELNLLDSILVKKFFEINKPSIVILAAAKVGGIYANSSYPADFLLENLKIQTNIIEAAWSQGSKQLIFLGSSCIYPKFSI